MNKSSNLHLIALLIISIYYISSLLIFNAVVINPHDILDIHTPYDYIISKIINGNYNAASNFLSGEIKWFHIENIFYPINFLHLIFEIKQFYFIEEILKKILSYFTFYLLAKSLIKNKFNSFISAILYSSILNLEVLFGYGIITMPYLLYLLTSKTKLKIKHFFILFFIGLNSSLGRDYLALITLIPLSILMRQSFKNLKIQLYYFLIITSSIIIAGSPIILSIIDFKDIHRVNSSSYGLDFSLNNIFHTLNYTKIYFFPKLILLNFILFLPFFLKEKKIYFLSFFFIFIYSLSFYIDILFKNFIFPFEFIQGYNFNRIARCLNLTICIIFAYNLKYLNNLILKKTTYILSFVTVIAIHLNYPIFEASKTLIRNNLSSETEYLELKKIILDKNNFTEFNNFLFDKKNYKKDIRFSKLKSNFTFDGYYKFETYKQIKLIVKEDRVMSIGIDPMIALMSDMKVIDGYHVIYPLDYKVKFRKIIVKELDKSNFLKNYYDIMGNRVYAFYNDKSNLLIDFKEAKKIGANYVISAFAILNENLEEICKKCNDNEGIFLYKII